jgi:hypothetical protein
VNNQERESKVVTFPCACLSLSPSLSLYIYIYIYIYLFKNFSTFTYIFTASCCTYNPKLSSDWWP